MILALLRVSVGSFLNTLVYCIFYRYNRGLQGSVIHGLDTTTVSRVRIEIIVHTTIVDTNMWKL